MTARAFLRAGTADAHQRVDRLFASVDLGSAEDYARFLSAQAAAFLPAERALDEAGIDAVVPDWTARRRGLALEADLDALGVPLPDPLPMPALDDVAAQLGALYVLEGSRLGGALLRRSIGPGLPRAFLDGPQPPGAWRKLLEKLDEFLYDPKQLQAATEAAREIFAAFEAGGRRYSRIASL